MSAHSVWLVEYGYVDRFPASNLFAAQPNEGFRRMPYCFGVIRTADECVLVDAGFWDPVIHDRLTVKYGQTRWKPPAEVLGRTGIAPDDISALLLTHNHFDHAGCAGQFAAAHLYIQREEIDRYRAALRLPPRFEFLTRNCEPTLPDVLATQDRAGRLTLADGRHAVTEHADRLQRGRGAAVSGRLEDDFLDLADRAAVPDGAADVRRELVHPVQGGQHSQVNQAARAPVEAGPGPDVIPAHRRDKLLQRAGELGSLRQRPVDVTIPENLAPDLGTAAQTLAVGFGHGAAPKGRHYV